MALPSAGSKGAARMAMMAITTSNSINVKAFAVAFVEATNLCFINITLAEWSGRG